MSQILHIFRKDTRRFWPEILLVLAVTVGLAVVTPSTWRLPMSFGRDDMQRALITAMRVLLPLTWWLLVARAVHAESLVGENQAWLTRPYEWTKLLAAKLLFCLAYVYLPLLVSQCVLVHMAGFVPQHFALGIAYDGLLLLEALILPLFLIASVTANFARMTLTLLGLMLAIAGTFLVAAQVWKSAASAPHQPGHNHWAWSTFGILLFLLGALVLQYRLRRVWLTRGVLVAAGLVQIAVLVYPGNAKVENSYPQAGATLLQVMYAPGPEAALKVYPATDHADQMEFLLPVAYSGVPEGYAAWINMKKISIDTATSHWESDWQSEYQRIVPGDWYGSLYFQVNREVYEKLRGQAVTLRVSFAISRLKAEQTSQTLMGSTGFSVGDGQFCARSSAWRSSNLLCRFAPQASTLMHLSAELKDASCASASAGLPHLTGSAWTGELGGEPGPFGFSAVAVEERQLEVTTDDGREYNGRIDLGLCPGTTIHLTPYRYDGRTRMELVMPGFVLPAKLMGEL